jgi:Tfp pilus assembly protein PilF
MSDSFSRACLLVERQRWAEAEKFLREHLSFDPEDDRALHLLAICARMGEARDEEALRIVDQAIARAPENGNHHALKAKILADLKRPKEAAASAEQALQFDPGDADFHAARAYVHQQQAEWALCEQVSRKALALDPDCVLAQNLLSAALTFQNRPDELAQNIGSRLARDPNDTLTHASAGWAALRAGDRRKAETHFLEALRLDASNESARLGLLDAFRSRSVIYRAHLAFSFFAASLEKKYRMWFFIGIYVAYKALRAAANSVSPVLGWLVVAFYLLFVLWGYVGKGIGTLLILADQRARLALKTRERWEGIAVGGSAILGMTLLLSALVWKGELSQRFALAGAVVAGMSVPWALSLSNDNRFGQRMYGVIASFVTLCALVVIAWVTAVPQLGQVGAQAFQAALFSTVACTWMALFRVKYE